MHRPPQGSRLELVGGAHERAEVGSGLEHTNVISITLYTVIRNNTDNSNITRPRITTPNNVKASPYNVFGRALRLREALSGPARV